MPEMVILRLTGWAGAMTPTFLPPGSRIVIALGPPRRTKTEADK